MTSLIAGGQGMGSEEGVVHHGEIQSVKQDSMYSNILEQDMTCMYMHTQTSYRYI